MDLTASLYRVLKTSGPQPARKIANILNVPVHDLRPVIDTQIKGGYLTTTPAGTIRLRLPLDPPTPIETIPLATPAVISPIPDEPLEKYENQLALFLPALNQGDNTSCVGHALAYVMLINYWRFQGVPGPDRLNDIIRDVRSPAGFRCDWYGFPLLSAWWIYRTAKKWGHMESSYGARLSDGMDVLQEIGAVPWVSCLTPTSHSDIRYYPLHGTEEETYTYLSGLAKDHRVISTAAGNLRECICDQIQIYGSAAIGIPVFSNFFRMGTGGEIPLPGPEDKQIGRHAIALYGFDNTKKIFRYLNSQRGLPTRGIISMDYVDKYGGLAYSPIDTSEPGIEDPEKPTIGSQLSNTSAIDWIISHLGR